MLTAIALSVVLNASPAPIFAIAKPASGCKYVGKIIICPDVVAKFTPVPNPEPTGTGGTGTRHRGSGRIEKPV